MKPHLPFLFLAFGAGISVHAVEPAPAAPAPTVARAEFASRLQEITQQLDLSAEQKAKIAPIVQQEVVDLRALHADARMRRLERARRFKEINQKASAQIRAELTPEQQAKYDELRAAARAEFKQKFQQRRAAGAN